MFGIELGEMFTLGVVALLIFGPERLPEVAVKAAHFIRKMRSAADSARSELTTSFGGELDDLDLRDLNPRTFVRRHVLDPVDEDGVLRSFKSTGNGSTAVKPGAGSAANGSATNGSAASGSSANGSAALSPTAAAAAAPAATALAKEHGSALPPAMSPPQLAVGDQPPFDPDAT